MKVEVPVFTVKPFTKDKKIEALWHTQRNARMDRLKELLNHCDGMSFMNNLGHIVVISKSLKGYVWQVSVFDEKGAIYDSQHNKVDEVIREIWPNNFASAEVIQKGSRCLEDLENKRIHLKEKSVVSLTEKKDEER